MDRKWAVEFTEDQIVLAMTAVDSYRHSCQWSATQAMACDNEADSEYFMRLAKRMAEVYTLLMRAV